MTFQGRTSHNRMSRNYDESLRYLQYNFQSRLALSGDGTPTWSCSNSIYDHHAMGSFCGFSLAFFAFPASSEYISHLFQLRNASSRLVPGGPGTFYEVWNTHSSVDFFPIRFKVSKNAKERFIHFLRWNFIEEKRRKAQNQANLRGPKFEGTRVLLSGHSPYQS